MEPGVTWQFIALLVLLFFSGFFSASETSLMSLSKIRLRNMVDEGVKGAELISKLIENPNKLLGSILVGNNVVNIGASALATSLAIDTWGSTGVGIATGIMTILVLIFGEIVPKSIATQNSEKVALKVSRVIAFIATILNPIIIVLISLTNVIVRLISGKAPKKQPFITEDELKTMVTVSHEEGVLENDEKKMIDNVFEFGDSQAKDVMTPRMDIVSVDINSTYDEILTIFKEEKFSRLPIYEENNDNIVGILYIKDFIFFEGDNETFNVKNFMREPFFTYEFKRTSELFAEMRTKHIPMAIVLDEYGGTDGIITIEDLVEEIVGDIRDEYDHEEVDEIEVIKEDEYVLRGSTRIDVVNELIGVHLESEDFDSIGGFVIDILGRFPSMGEKIEHNNIQFIIEEIEKNRIEKLRMLT
ncbi:putative hemolysin [Desulfonispora thiosulfatigenes DSM 11270]|uniref:Putative hemolysin n=1 Tax=Desulfonispora thiosulfatigenes DSM 11270 TaxID=656914 RepID=A0A1W1UQC2_DESTI|nr:hemolysin family protein [Desulfonispora thiosulfatigenes]SMB82894.1 putative hemolysin [Desulfonispora thiosulfatigenes DSM 11270]